MTEVVEGKVNCDVRAGQCRCFKPADHVESGDLSHECDPRRCTGSWEGDIDSNAFKIIRVPIPVGEPVPWDLT